MFLPSALLAPTTLLLPYASLLLGTLRRLLGALRRLRLLSPLLRLRLLGSLLRLRLLGPLLLLRLLGPLLLLRLLGGLLLGGLLNPLLRLSLLGALLLGRLLSPLLLLRLLGTLLLLRLLGALLRLRLRCTLLLRRLLSLLLLWWGASLPFRLILLLSIVVGLGVCGSNRSEKQKHRHCAGKNEFHEGYLLVDGALGPPTIAAAGRSPRGEFLVNPEKLLRVPGRNDIRSYDLLSSKRRSSLHMSNHWTDEKSAPNVLGNNFKDGDRSK